MSTVFFFLFGAIGAMTPFLSLYYRNAGLSGTEISLLLSVTPVLLFISQPVFGPLTDRSGHRGRMLSWLALAVSASALLMAFGSSFWTLLPGVLLWAFFSGPLVPIADSLALGEVVRTGVGYPQLRLWGSVGFVLTTTLCGWLYNGMDLRWAFLFYAVLNLATIIFARRLPAEGIAGGRPIWPALKSLLKNPLLGGFLLLSALLQTTQAAHSSFFSIHVENLGGSTGLIGLAWAIAALTEVPVWLVLSRITRRTGPIILLALASFMYGLRWYLFASAQSPNAILWLQLLHAFSFAIFMPTAVVLVGELVPAEIRTSGQALLVLVNGGIATVVGNVVAGRLVDLAGTGYLYEICAYVAFAATAGFLLLFWRVGRGATASTTA